MGLIDPQSDGELQARFVTRIPRPPKSHLLFLTRASPSMEQSSRKTSSTISSVQQPRDSTLHPWRKSSCARLPLPKTKIPLRSGPNLGREMDLRISVLSHAGSSSSNTSGRQDTTTQKTKLVLDSIPFSSSMLLMSSRQWRNAPKQISST